MKKLSWISIISFILIAPASFASEAGEPDPYSANYFERLGLPAKPKREDLTDQYIKSGMKKAGFMYYPDLSPLPEKEARAAMQKINEAYDVLKDETIRIRYWEAIDKGTDQAMESFHRQQEVDRKARHESMRKESQEAQERMEEIERQQQLAEALEKRRTQSTDDLLEEMAGLRYQHNSYDIWALFETLGQRVQEPGVFDALISILKKESVGSPYENGGGALTALRNVRNNPRLIEALTFVARRSKGFRFYNYTIKTAISLLADRYNEPGAVKAILKIASSERILGGNHLGTFALFKLRGLRHPAILPSLLNMAYHSGRYFNGTNSQLIDLLIKEYDDESGTKEALMVMARKMDRISNGYGSGAEAFKALAHYRGDRQVIELWKYIAIRPKTYNSYDLAIELLEKQMPNTYAVKALQQIANSSAETWVGTYPWYLAKKALDAHSIPVDLSCASWLTKIKRALTR